jgi:hypothetical protein
VVISTASSNDSDAGSRYRALTWWTAYSANPPSVVMPDALCPLAGSP